MKRYVRLFVLPLLACCIHASLLAQAPAGLPPQPVSNVEYLIQVGDELDVKFFYNQDLNEHVIVRPDGRISLQLIPEIVAANQTPAQLTRLLAERYATQLKQPTVAVIVRSFGAQRIYVDGEVSRPGVIPMVGSLSTMQAIAQAGGMKDSARTTEVVVIRRSLDGKAAAYRVNIKKVHDRKELAQDVLLAPLDIVYVPRSRIANVDLWVDEYLRKNIPIPFGFQLIP